MNRSGNGTRGTGYGDVGDSGESGMPREPGVERTKRRRDKLINAGLIEKTVWIPAVFAAHLSAFALELRRKAGLLLPTDPRNGDGTSPESAISKLAKGQAPIVEQAAATLASGEHAAEARSRVRRQRPSV